ncbi:MAG: hypothetical protein LBD64_02420 [Odoribacteraceae bacterium]|jgi:hypothetical protein|nr:hypothetical protein [Odoribacteraceae bacterium]
MGLVQPRREADFIIWVNVIYAEVVTHATVWKLDNDVLQRLSLLYHDAKNAYDDNLDKNTRSRATVSKKNESFRCLREFMRLFERSLSGNLNITNEEIIAMGLPSRIRHAGYYLSMSRYASGTKVAFGECRELEIFVSVPQLGHSTSYVRGEEDCDTSLKYKKKGGKMWVKINYAGRHVTIRLTDE